MDAILGLLSILGFFVSFLLFVVAFLRKKAKKKWAINMAVFFAVFLFAISWPSEQANTENNTSSQPADDSKQLETTEQSVGIDGVLKGDCFDISVVDIKWTDALETSLGTIEPDDASNGLLCIIFSAKNTMDSVQNVASIGFNAYADGKKVIPKVVVGSIDDAVVFVGAVSPGMEIVGHVVWELPSDWDEFQTSYIDAGTAVESKQHFVICKEDIN